MINIKIINFPFCNFFSLERYLRVKGLNYSIIDNGNTLNSKDILFIPGVGTFGEGMNYLKDLGLDTVIKSHADKGGKIIGICLGMQLLFCKSEESPLSEGLSFFEGICKKIPFSKNFSIPHIGWNSLKIIDNNKNNLLKEFKTTSNISKFDYYFVHSFYADPKNIDCILAYFDHPEKDLTASVQKDNIYGFQFHPEKSGKAGYLLLDKVLKI